MADVTSTSGSGEWLSPAEETAVLPPHEELVQSRPVPPPPPSTGWTVTMPVLSMPQPPTPTLPVLTVPPQAVPAQAPVGLGGGPRGRILVIEGGYGGAGRRPWGRTGSAQAPILSAMLAAVSPQILLAADSVDAVHLPGAADPQSVLAHLRAAARHPGPLLVHVGGHLVTDRRGGHLYLTLRDSKTGTVRQDGLAWQSVAEELRHRSAEWGTLVIADLSADQAAWPQLQSSISPLKDGIPLWAVVSPDPEQIGTFTRALIEALHGGRPGAEAVLAPEQLSQQVHSVLRPDVIIMSSYPADRPVFRNTARRLGDGTAEPRPYDGPRPAAVMPKPPTRAARPRPAANRVTLAKGSGPAPTAPVPAPAPAPAAPPRPARRPVTLLKAGVPPTPPRPARPVSLLKLGALPVEAEADTPIVSLSKPAPVPEPDATPLVRLSKPRPAGARPVAPQPVEEIPVQQDLAAQDPAQQTSAQQAFEPAPAKPDYREAIGRIVRSADAGEHAIATELALELEQLAISTHGPVAPAVLQVRQVRAHVSRLGGQPSIAADLYREVALTLLRSQGPDHPETQQAATNAEACWRAVTDRAEAIRLAPEIIELRAYLPGPGGRKLRASERYLKQLVAAQGEGPDA